MGKVIGFSVPQKIIGKTYGDSCSPDIFIGNQFSVWGKAKGYSLCSVGSKRMLCSIEVAVYRVTIQSNVILVEGELFIVLLYFIEILMGSPLAGKRGVVRN